MSLPVFGLTLGIFLMFAMVYFAFAGPSKAKAGSRRLEALKERHSGSVAVAAQVCVATGHRF